MYFLKKLVWLYAVHPWLILREKGWQLNYEVTKDTVINVQNLSVWRPFPRNAIHYRNSNVFFAFGCCWSWSCMPGWDTQNTAMLKCHQALVTTPLCCWSPLNCTSLLRAPALLRGCPPCPVQPLLWHGAPAAPALLVPGGPAQRVLGIPAGACSSQLHLALRKKAPKSIPLSCLFSLKTSRKTFLVCNIQAALTGELHSSRCTKKS